jgi:hypothetical protein
MTRKSTSAVAIGAAAIGILAASAVPALAHGRGPGESDVSLACPMAGEGMGAMMRMMGPDAMGSMMGPDAMGSMMGSMMGPDALEAASGPVDEDTSGDSADHAAHHPAATPEPTE